MKIYTLQEFEDLKFEHDYKGRNIPLEMRTKKKYNLTKPKTLKPRIVECRLDDNGIPYEHVIQEKVTKQVANTNKITELIVDFLIVVIGSKSARRISSEGRYRPDGKGGGKWIGGVNNGLEDAHGNYNGREVCIELKATKGDKQREKQILRQQQVEADGGVYLLLRWTTFEDFQKLLYQKLGLYI
jgi:hypothetical protein